MVGVTWLLGVERGAIEEAEMRRGRKGGGLNGASCELEEDVGGVSVLLLVHYTSL